MILFAGGVSEHQPSNTSHGPRKKCRTDASAIGKLERRRWAGRLEPIIHEQPSGWDFLAAVPSLGTVTSPWLLR